MASPGPEGDFDAWCTSADKATRVHWAALQGQPSELAAFLAAGDDPDARDFRGCSPLHWAAQRGQAACISQLVAAGADLEARGWGCGTPLHVAAEAGGVEAVRALLSAGADVNAAEREGLHLCCITPLWLAAAAGQVAAMRELIAAGADVEAGDNAGWTPLFYAAAAGQVAVVRQLILAGARCDAKDNDGWRPVHHAARAVDDEAVAVMAALEEGGADLTARTSGHGWTPLHCAALSGQAAAIKWLLQKGLDLDAKDANGCTPLHAAASEGDQLEAVEALLAAGADVAAQCNPGWAPLHVAAVFGCIKVMRALVAAGADMGTLTADGRAPIHLAALGGHVAAVLELAAAGVDINTMSGSGMSSLHYFVLHVAATEVLEAPQQLASLLSAGASAEVITERTGTTVDLLLSLHKLRRQAQGLQSMPESYSYIPNLIRMLAAAGCPLDGAGSFAGLINMHLEEGSPPVSTFSYWLTLRPTQGILWPHPLSPADLRVAEALLQCSASQGHLVQARDFFCAACRGDKCLMQALLVAYPQCLQQLQCTLFCNSRTYRTNLSTIFIRRLRRLPVPSWARGVLPERHRSLVRHFCELAGMLLAAGCPRQSICIRGRQVPGSVRRLGLGRDKAVRVPGWAMDILSFLPLLAAGVEWSPQTHPDFPPAFRAAARELLAINQCCGFGAEASSAAAAGIEAGGLRGQGECVQGFQLPNDVLHHILHLAARPFPAWVP